MKKILNANDKLLQLFPRRLTQIQELPGGESKADKILHELNEMQEAEETYMQSLKGERLGG